MTMNSIQEKSIFSILEPTRVISISTDGLSRGIDNYHIDVRLSRKFSSDTKKLIALLIPQVATPKPKAWDNSKQLKSLRASYIDMMTVLIHRVKTDLSRDHVVLLQFAAIKYILKIGRSQLDLEIGNTSARLTELKSRGASEALATDQRLFWLRRNYDNILYRVNKSIFGQIQRAEEQDLSAIRQQFLGQEFQLSVDGILNPLLWTSNLSNLTSQLQDFSLWDINSEEAGFHTVDSIVSALTRAQLADLPLTPIKPANTTAGEAEINDELGGLFQLQSYTGTTKDSKNALEESLDWIEVPGNVKNLFEKKWATHWLAEKRQRLGFFGAWKYKKDAKQLSRFMRSFVKQLKKENLLPQLAAASVLKKSMSPLLHEHAEPKNVCLFLMGKITLQKLQETISGNHKLNPEQVKLLEQHREAIAEQNSDESLDLALSLLVDLGNYRRCLKLFRFAHRAFNRISILTDEDELKLSKSAGTLYQLPIHSEVEEADAKICHHTILKADVRGSTTVTDELLKKGLNPASYFSMRFFNPINKILDTYDANKVFIEGDAIILSFLEYEGSPEQWFSVARACGYAKDMLIITGANNRYSSQMGLPLLELGVGICYAAESPRFLYDEDHPIMISSAIGLADRLSGCSWKLRAAVKKSLFNVDVLQIADGETSKGEKGQDYVRYNVNGINIDDLAFEKLNQEISLQRLSVKLNGTQYIFHVGSYPDTKGKKKDLVIREGHTGIWADNEILADRNRDESYYEVVVNRKVIPVILDAARKIKTATAP